jgi:hypothetical protein
MKRFFIIFFFIQVIIFVGCEDKSGNVEDNIIRLDFTPSEAVIAVGEDASIELKVNDIDQPFFALSMRIEYDSSVVAFLEADFDDDSSIFSPNAITFVQNAGSIIHLSLTQIQGQPSVSASGNLATFTFKGLSPDSCSINILPDDLHFYDSSGAEIEVFQPEISNALIIVTNP